MDKKLVIGVTGASGIVYTHKLLEYCSLLRRKYNVLDLIYTRNSEKVAKHELGLNLTEFLKKSKCINHIYSEDDWSSPLASSSNLVGYDGVIIPASMNTVAKLANSIQDNLLLRVFSSLLRLKNKVVIVFRETPLSAIDLYNLYKLAMLGAIVLPASPAFYIRPRDLSDILDFIVGKILDVLGVEHALYKRWSGLDSTV